MKKLSQTLEEIGLQPVEELTKNKMAWTWQTQVGLTDGTLFVGHLDVPLTNEIPIQVFRRTPEWLYGEGIGLSRAPLVMLEFVLKALKNLKQLNSVPVGVLYYADEGRDNIESSDIIKAAVERAKRVLVLRPGNPQNKVVIERRGWRKYQLVAEDKPTRLGKVRKKPEILRWVCNKLEDISKLSSRQNRISIAVSDIHPTTFPMLLPHKVDATILMSYGDKEKADDTETLMKEMLTENGFSFQLENVSDRPAMKKSVGNKRLVADLAEVASNWEIPFGHESSLWPSVAGLVPSSTPVVCGLGPVTRDAYTPNEAVERISLLQRTLLVAEFLAKQAKG
jgi:D-alanine-D-alanine ligase